MRPKRIIAFSILLLVLAGCNKRAHVTALPPPRPAPAPAPTPAPAPAPLPEPAPPPPAPVVSPLDRADSAFVAGSYDAAARAYEDYLRSNPAGAQRDDALFHLGLVNALRPAPSTDWQRASAAFKQLVDEYPNSPYKPPAGLILALRSELDQISADSKQRDQRIKQLTTELDRLKKIDADRRKRP